MDPNNSVIKRLCCTSHIYVNESAKHYPLSYLPIVFRHLISIPDLSKNLNVDFTTQPHSSPSTNIMIKNKPNQIVVIDEILYLHKMQQIAVSEQNVRLSRIQLFRQIKRQ